LLAATSLATRRAGGGGGLLGRLRPYDWQVVGAIDGEAQFLPVLIDEQQEHEDIRQNDRDYRNHSDIPYLAVAARPVRILERPILDPSVRPLSLFTTAGLAAEGTARLTEVGPSTRALRFNRLSNVLAEAR
jgi:hypothetical protein